MKSENSTRLAAAIMAAGKGTRMRSAHLPKVLHELAGRSMIMHVIHAANEIISGPLHVIVGHGADKVEQHVANCSSRDLKENVRWVYQHEQLGTGHAVQQLLPEMQGYHGHLLILNGDVPLLTAETLKDLWAHHLEGEHAATILTTRLLDPTGYGRIIKDNAGHFISIREHKDCAPEELKIDEVNTGIYLFEWQYLHKYLPELKNDNAKKEFYLTDILGMFVKAGLSAGVFCKEDQKEVMGINSRKELAEVEDILQKRLQEKWMLAGVTLRRPESIHLDCSIELAQDIEILPGTCLYGHTTVASGTRLGPNTILTNAIVGSFCEIVSSTIQDATVADHVTIGPYAHIRPETVIASYAKVGNFVELKKTHLGEYSKASHLAYLGNASIGSHCNIGAGTITCNYDGAYKHPTMLGDQVFVGSNATLVAPVTIGNEAFLAAGSVITEDVPAGALGMGRARQVNKEGWVAKRRPRK